MIFKFLEILLVALGGGCIVFSLVLLLNPALKKLRMRIRTDRRHQQQMKQQEQLLMRVLPHLKEAERSESEKKKDSWYKVLGNRIHRELELLLKTIRENYDEESTIRNFVILNLSIVISVGLISYILTNNKRFSVFMALLVQSFIYGLFRVRLRRIQIQEGYYLAEAVGVLSSKYKVVRGNMRQALKQAATEITSKRIRNHFREMVREELNYEDVLNMERRIEEFVFSINTSFAKQLGLTILKGLVRGENVESTLMNIDKNIHKNMDMLEDEGDSSSDVLQLSWLHLLLFPALMIFMIAFMGWTTTIHFQFESEDGRFWFTVVICFIAFSLFMAFWFRKPPNDY